MAKKNGKTNGEANGEAVTEATEKKSGGGQALDLPRATAFKADPDILTIIGRDTKHKKGEHPLWDKRGLYEARESLVKAMILFGWQGAISVARDGDMTVVTDGRQRVIAAREANRRLKEQGEDRRIEVMCLTPVRGEDSRKTAIMATMNEHRTQDDIIERARKMENMLRFDATIEDIAVAFAETEQTVKNYLKALECHSDIIKAAERGEVAPSVLVTLSALNRDDQLAEFEKMKADGKLTVTEAQQRVRNKKNGTQRENTEAVNKIPLPVARKMYKLYKAKELESDISEEAMKMVGILAGLIPPNSVRGVLGALRQVGYVDE